MKIKTLATATMIAFLGFSANASEKKLDNKHNASRVVQGSYTVVSGSVETFDISSDPTKLEQLGTYSILLKNTEWNRLPWRDKLRVRKYVHITGSLKGTIDVSNLYTVGPVVSHVMIDDDRSTVIRSENDVFYPVSGDLFCSTGSPMEILEYVNLVGATGQYENLTSGTISLSGTVNNCPGQEDYGKYDLSVVPGESTLIFE